MQATSESIKQDIENLSNAQRQKVAEFIAFLKFQEKRSPQIDTDRLESLMEEFAEEDRLLAEAGMDDYVSMLAEEDK